MSEFIEWVTLVDELADWSLKEISVTPKTWTMLVKEWQSARGYSWSKFSICKDYAESGNNLTLKWHNKRSLKVVLEEGVTP
jgi:hypothetical protein